MNEEQLEAHLSAIADELGKIEAENRTILDGMIEINRLLQVVQAENVNLQRLLTEFQNGAHNHA